MNDAPVNTVPGPQSVDEDTVLAIAGVPVADVDSRTLTTTLTVTSGTLTVTAGAGVTGNGIASVTITGTAAEINAALAGVNYTGNLNFNGGETLTVATADGSATDTDRRDHGQSGERRPGQYGTGRAERQRGHPARDRGCVGHGRGRRHAHHHADGDERHAQRDRRPGRHGNGTACVTITGTAAEINAALPGLAYTGNLNFNGADTLTVATSDGSLTDTDTVAITVTAVNDAPVNTVPGPQSVDEDTVLPIAGVSVADVDGGTLTTTLTVTSGTLNVTAGDGVSRATAPPA